MLNDIVNALFSEGDIIIVAIKGHGKTIALMNLARELRKIPHTRVIIFEDFPKWIKEFDSIPYFVIEDTDIRESKHAIDLSDIWLRHERDYTILRGYEIKQTLKHNKDIIFLMDIEDIDREAFFLYSIFNHFYRKAYLRAYKGIQKKERVVFLWEESQNIANSNVLNRKVFLRFKKKFNVCRNLGLHNLLATQRFQSVSTEIRGRCQQLIGRVNTDDYELKVRRLLRHSKHRKEVTKLSKGDFIFVSTDTIIKFPYPFKQNGKPYEFKPKPKPQPQPKTLRQKLFRRKPNRKHGFIETLKSIIFFPFYLPKQPRSYRIQDEDLNEEHASLLASNENEETESLYWD